MLIPQAILSAEYIFSFSFFEILTLTLFFRQGRKLSITTDLIFILCLFRAKFIANLFVFYLKLTQRVRQRRRYTEELVDEEQLIFGGRSFDVEEKLYSPRFEEYKCVREMTGEELTMAFIQEKGFDRPFLVTAMKGLGMRMPTKSFSVDDVKVAVGSRRVLDVMDVETQRDFNMTMKVIQPHLQCS